MISFDLVVAATSIHWMDLDTVLPIIHRLLVPGGMFLVWRNVFEDPSVPPTPFRERGAEIVRERDSPLRPGPGAENIETASRDLTRTGLFSVDDRGMLRWSTELGEGEVNRLFNTFSDWKAEEVDHATAAVRELGGRVVEHHTSCLIAMSPR